MSPLIKSPIDTVPQFDAVVLKKKLYSMIVAQPAVPLFVGFESKTGKSIPILPGTPVMHLPAPTFGLLMLLKLPTPISLVSDLVAKSILNEDQGKELQAQIDKATNPINLIKETQLGAVGTLGLDKVSRDQQKVIVDAAKENEVQIAKDTEEKTVTKIITTPDGDIVVTGRESIFD